MLAPIKKATITAPTTLTSFPPFESTKREMSGSPNRKDSLHPVQATGRKSSFVGRMANALGGLVSGANKKAVSTTSPETIAELVRERQAAYIKQGQTEYVLAGKLAQSSEGEVFIYKCSANGKHYVMKHTFPHVRLDSDWKLPMDSSDYHYPNEARILETVLAPHPNVITLYETTRDQDYSGRYKMWMELAGAGDLYGQIEFWTVKRRSYVPEVFLLHFAVEVMQALAFLHHGLRYDGNGKWTQDDNHKSVIHGDIKPENVLLRWSSIPLGGMPDILLGDFGVARIAGDDRVKLLPGTNLYHAPEDLAITGGLPHSKENLDRYYKVGANRTVAADMYSFGQILYQMASKEPNPRKIGRDPSDIRVSRDYDTQEIRELLVRCLVADPAKRAEASSRGDIGVLPLVEKLRQARDQLIRTKRPLDPLEWNSPPPPPKRS